MQRFQVFDVSLELVRGVRVVIAEVARHDGSLASQMRRAAASVPANITEGNRRVGKDRLQLWRVAAGSADELCAHIRVAEAWGYTEPATIAEALELADRVLAMLWRLCNGRR